MMIWAASIAALGIAGYGAAYWALPSLVRRIATETVRERLSRDLHLGTVRVDPFRLRITIDDLRLPDAQGGPMLGWRHAELRLRPLRSLWLRAPVLTDVRVEGLQLLATVDTTGRMNLADLSKLSGPDDGSPPARWLIESLTLEGEGIRYRELDRSPDFSLQLARLTARLTDFGNAGPRTDAMDLALSMHDGGRIAIRGHLHPVPLMADASLSVTGLPLDTVARYVGNALPFEFHGGSLALDGEARIDGSGQSLAYAATLKELQFADASLRTRGAPADLVLVKSVTATGGSIDSRQRTLAVSRLAVEGVDVKAWRNADGSFNLSALYGPATRVEPGKGGATSAAAWRWSIPDITVSGARVSMADRSVRPETQVAFQDLGLHVTGLSQDLSVPLDVDLDSRVDNGGHVRARGKGRIDTATFKGQVELHGIELRPAQPYISQAADILLLSGRLDGAVEVETGPEGLHVRGESAVRDLRTVDSALRQDFVQWKRLQASGLEFDSMPRPRLRIRELMADSPYSRVIIGGDRQLNLSQIFRVEPPPPLEDSDIEAATTQPETPTPPTVADAAAPPAMDVEIGVVHIRNGSANFADLWIQPNFAVGILDLEGSIKGLSSKEGSRAAVDLKGAVDRYAPVVIRGEMNPLSASLSSDITMSFRNLDLTTVTPYSGRFAGYEIQKGKLNLDLEYHIKARRLDARHHLVVDQLELGDPVESRFATSLPVRLALALLKDRHGVIDVQLPVSGSLDDPRFRIGPLVWRMIGNLFVKAVTSPFALLGRLFGGGDDVNQVVFMPGTTDLDEASRQRLDVVRKAMVERPGLRLDVPAAWSADVDRPAMLRRQLEAQLAAIAGTTGPDRHQQLLAAWREEAGLQPPPEGGAEELEQALLVRYEVGDQELEDLGRRRALVIQDLLFATKEIDPVRVFVVDGEPAATDAQHLRVDLRLR
ncbi:MAG: hypothetical protein RLZZ200_1173 [Pseudomonadota bacterium]|jgi:hypothetical protein